MKSYREVYEAFYGGKSPATAEGPRKSRGTWDLIVSVLWFLAAFVSFFVGGREPYVSVLLGGVGLYFLIRGLVKKGVRPQ